MFLHIKRLILTLSLLCLLPFACGADDSGPKHPPADHKGPAILLVTFGTSVPSAQAAFVNIEQQVRAVFPESEIRWAYTSKIIRKKLAKSGTSIDSPETALARMKDDGFTQVVVQSLHMIPGEEFQELATHAKLFEQLGVDKVTVSAPLLSSDEAMEGVLKTIVAAIIPPERKSDEAVILMGHGTHHPSDAVYSAMMYKAQRMDANLYVATVEGHPTFAEVKAMLKKKGITKAYLIPLMTVAGDHAKNDMAGDEPGSWKSQLTKEGIASVPVMKGLAEYNPVVAFWIDNLKMAMGQMK